MDAILVVFVLTYVGVAIGHIPGLRLNRVGIALLGAIAAMAFARASAQQVAAWVNWPTMFVLFGFFVLSAQLRLSGFYDRLAAGLSAQLEHPRRFLLLLMGATAGLSAVLNNDIVCYVFTPVVGAALLRRKLNPVPFLIGLALASNLGAAATPIGNAQGILIAEVARLSFRHYVVWCFVPVVAALATAFGLVSWSLERWGELSTASAEDCGDKARPFDRAHTIKGLVIFVVVVALCLTSLPKEVVVLVAAGIHLASPKFRTEDILDLVDWPLLVLFLSLFVVTGAFQATGYAQQAVHSLESAGFSLARPTNELIATAGLTALINNAPAVMLLLKLVPLAQPVAAYVMALGNSFAGNLLLTSSVANIVVVQQARRQGIVISFGAFARLGVPAGILTLALAGGWAMLVH